MPNQQIENNSLSIEQNLQISEILSSSYHIKKRKELSLKMGEKFEKEIESIVKIICDIKPGIMYMEDAYNYSPVKILTYIKHKPFQIIDRTRLRAPDINRQRWQVDSNWVYLPHMTHIKLLTYIDRMKVFCCSELVKEIRNLVTTIQPTKGLPLNFYSDTVNKLVTSYCLTMNEFNQLSDDVVLSIQIRDADGKVYMEHEIQKWNERIKIVHELLDKHTVIDIIKCSYIIYQDSEQEMERSEINLKTYITIQKIITKYDRDNYWNILELYFTDTDDPGYSEVNHKLYLSYFKPYLNEDNDETDNSDTDSDTDSDSEDDDDESEISNDKIKELDEGLKFLEEDDERYNKLITGEMSMSEYQSIWNEFYNKISSVDIRQNFDEYRKQIIVFYTDFLKQNIKDIRDIYLESTERHERRMTEDQKIVDYYMDGFYKLADENREIKKTNESYLLHINSFESRIVADDKMINQFAKEHSELTEKIKKLKEENTKLKELNSEQENKINKFVKSDEYELVA